MNSLSICIYSIYGIDSESYRHSIANMLFFSTLNRLISSESVMTDGFIIYAGVRKTRTVI